MRVKDATVLVCDCEGTMPLDGARIARACSADATIVATQLCGREIDRFERALEAGGPVAVACAQEIDRFEEVVAERGVDARPTFFDIRARAGWSDEARHATPKIAALIADALATPATLPTLPLTSKGVALVYGRDQVAIDAAHRLADKLNITVLLTDPTAVAPPSRNRFPILFGRIARAQGHLGTFALTVDGFAQPAPSSRGAFAPGVRRDGATSTCDIILDLAGGPALFPAPAKRDGYLRADPRDPGAVADAVWRAADLVGEFEKPRWITPRTDLCVHQRSKKIGCRRCLDLCPTGAIAPAGDHVEVDPAICAGCGSCAAVCPTGAVTYAPAPADHMADRLRGLLGAYLAAGGSDPLLLIHEAEHGLPLIEAAARHGRGLPARVLPLAVDHLTQIGVDLLASALAFGASELVLLRPARRRDDLSGLAHQLGVVAAVADGLGLGGDRVRLLETDDPDALDAALRQPPATPMPVPARHLAIGGKREVAKLALRHLHATAPAPVDRIALPAGAIFGQVVVDAAGCTLCLSCVSACPTGALSDDPERPELAFTEDACVQCGLCQRTCPEKVITLAPRIDFTPEARARRVIKAEEPFHCVRCAKPFGTKSSVEAVLAKLAGKHWMFAASATLDRLKMCGNCRIVVQSESALDPYAGPARPATRTAADYREDLVRRTEQGRLDEES